MKTGALLSLAQSLLCLALLALAPITSQAQSSTWPSRPVSLVVGFAPGGSADILARAIGQRLSSAIGQPVVVENRPGAGATIAAAQVATAAPDGHTLLFVTSGHAGSGALYPGLRYDPVKSFSPVIRIAATPVVIVVPAAKPWKTLGELIGAVRQAPGRLNYAAGGGGATTTALAAEFLKHDLGLNMVQISYKGSGPALTALVGGEVEIGFEIPSSALPHLQSGRLRALAVTSRERSTALPEVPTAIEQGIADFEVIGWFGLLAPAGTPAGVIERLNREVNGLLGQVDLRERLRALGLEVGGGSSDAFRALIESDTQRYGAAIRRLGLTAQ